MGAGRQYYSPAYQTLLHSYMECADKMQETYGNTLGYLNGLEPRKAGFTIGSEKRSMLNELNRNYVHFCSSPSLSDRNKYLMNLRVVVEKICSEPNPEIAPSLFEPVLRICREGTGRVGAMMVQIYQMVFRLSPHERSRFHDQCLASRDRDLERSVPRPSRSGPGLSL